MGVLAGLAVAALSVLVRQLECIAGKPSDEFAGVDADDVLVLFPVALRVGWAEGLLRLGACGVTAVAWALYLTHYRKFSAR